MQITKTLGYWKSSLLGNLKSYRISLQTSRLATRISCHCHWWWWKPLTSSLVKGREGGDSKVIARGSTGLKSKQSGPPRSPSSWLNNHRGKLQPQPRQPCVLPCPDVSQQRSTMWSRAEWACHKSSVKDKQFCGCTCATWHQRGRRV